MRTFIFIIKKCEEGMYKYKNNNENSSPDDLSFHYIEGYLNALNIQSGNKSNRKLFRKALKSIAGRIENKMKIDEDWSEKLLDLVDLNIKGPNRYHVYLSTVVVLLIICTYMTHEIWSDVFKMPWLVLFYGVLCCLDILTFKDLGSKKVRAANLGLDNSLKVTPRLFNTFKYNHLKKSFYGNSYGDVICLVYLICHVLLTQNVYKF